MLVTQLRLHGDEIHCQHNCLLHHREGGLVEAVEQVENRVTREESHMFSVNSKPKRLAAENRVTAREEDLFSLIDSKSFTSSSDRDGSPYCVLVEEEVEVVEAPQVLNISEAEEEEENNSIFSPHFSDPLLCSISPTSSTVVSVRCTILIFSFSLSNTLRRQDETQLVLEASGDFLLEEEDAPITILEEVQTAEMEVVFCTFFNFFIFLLGGTDIRVRGVQHSAVTI